ncbi:MAG: hypothetical protein ACOC6L_03850 [Thermodesulfobacteriota bacterium]
MMATTFLKKSCQGLSGLAGTEGRPRAAFLAAWLVAVLWLVPGCPTPPEVQELKKEVTALKTEVAGLKEKIIQVEAGQKVLMELLKKAPSAQGPAPGTPEAAVPGTAGQPFMPGQPQPTTAEPMTMEELFKNKDELLGTRVTVKGVPGPVLMHKKTLFLGGPKGMVEVIYGNLQDKKQVERLTAQSIDTPITVSGLLSAAPGQTKEPVRLIIMADMVEF